MTQSRAAAVADGLTSLLTPLLDGRAAVRRLWVPSFDADEIANPVVTVRAAGRARSPAGKLLSDRDVLVEVGLIQRLPEPANSSEDPLNNMALLDALDALAEELFDLFVPVEDPDELPEGSNSGLYASHMIAGHLPAEVEQPTAVDVKYLQENRTFIAVIVITYRLRD